MPKGCRTPGCGRRAQPGGRYCLECASQRRLAQQRKRRGHAYPAGPLPAEATAALLARLEELREIVDQADQRRFVLAGESSSEASDLLRETMEKVRAAVLQMREPLLTWNDLNAVHTRDEQASDG